MRHWRIDGDRQTLALSSEGNGLPEVIHWGARLPDDEDLTTLAALHRRDVTGGMLDRNPALSLCPEASNSFPGQPGLVLRSEHGAPLLPHFTFAAETVDAGHLNLEFRDTRLGLTYRVEITGDPLTGVLTLASEVESDLPIWLDWLAAPVLPGPQLSDEMIDVAGRWCGEFQLVRTPWSPGARFRESWTGRSGHEHFPGMIVPARGTTNTGGEAWGLHYGWSGGHRMIAEELPDGRRQIQFGNAAGTEPRPGRTFRTAPLYAVYTPEGLNGVGAAFQRHLRDHVVPWVETAKARPVHYNCWEAVYFDHDLETLSDIAERAAELGAERFVLDDGWFGRRDDDTSSLGDWEIDRRKWPDGLTPLIDRVHALGMSFGLWFEPEMVNPDSDLARAHPDWILGHADQITGRHQMVLDMANGSVRDHLHSKISAILGAHRIAYVKWDHNRVLPSPDASQTRGTYDLLDRLRADFPHVEIESCASGGGRIDFGILSRTQRVWLSDSNDALERLRIQHDAALFLPAAVTGSHVGPRTCHTSGRVLDMRFRAWVAAQRHMGFEMDPRELTGDEVEVLKRVTAWWKDNRDWRMRADILRLDSADPSVIAEQQLAQDGSRFVVFAGQTETSRQIAPRPLRLTRLDPAARYRVRLLNAEDATRLSRGDVALKAGPLNLSGCALMNHGLSLPWSSPNRIWVVEGERLE